MNRFTCTLTTLVALTALISLALPRSAAAETGWSWWDAIEAQQNHSPKCDDSPPTRDDWEVALGNDDDPHWTELTVYFIAYPCSASPAVFLEFRDWLNYEVHDVGVWKTYWQYQKFYELKDLVYELDQSPAGFFESGPWG